MSLEPVYFAAKYRAGFGLAYLSSDPGAWNNVYMAEFYGLDSLRSSAGNWTQAKQIETAPGL